MSPIDSVNSFEDAVNFWNTEYGKPDFYSKPEDITEVTDMLLQYEDELHSLETEIIRRDGDLPHYKINRAIVLHFVVEAAEQYITKLHDMIYCDVYEGETDKLTLIENSKGYWEE